ncbi:MAG: ATP synthase F0 subunit B [Desulfobacteraceae bacterium]|nr:ATP synthase F0 subunit B [Desulfobacteraceae bacterium]MCB9494494.1 ATP synthase F0 subunit B [Desulfobacteraceae bacterium]
MSVDISLNSSIIIQIVNFVVLIIALNIVLYKPIRGILAKRKAVVDSLSEDAKKAVYNAKESEIKFREDIKSARIDGARKKNELIEKAAEEESRILSELQKESMAKFNEVKEKLSKETEAARASLEKDIGEFASQIAKKVLGRAV